MQLHSSGDAAVQHRRAGGTAARFALAQRAQPAYAPEILNISAQRGPSAHSLASRAAGVEAFSLEPMPIAHCCSAASATATGYLMIVGDLARHSRWAAQKRQGLILKWSNPASAMVESPKGAFHRVEVAL
jgi:hypothetical protein